MLPLSKRSKTSSGSENETLQAFSRRKVVKDSAATFFSVVFGGAFFKVESTSAFPNNISDKYNDRPKRRGPQPKDLGLKKRMDMGGEEYVGLKNCGAAPNCFCSTDNEEDDPSHAMPPWIWPSSLEDRDVNGAFEQLSQVVNTYQPGQSNIDGGGFKVITSDTSKGYVYAQFESLKNGFIDDFEVAYLGPGGPGGARAVQVRSSSRVGYLDYGVNGKRINFISKALRDKGWNAPGVDFKGQHRSYADENGFTP
jgi:uncharacterized protein (DUF1499 family)